MGSPMNEPRAGFGAVSLGNRIYVAAGELVNAGRTLDSVEYYDTGADAWQTAKFTLHIVRRCAF